MLIAAQLLYLASKNKITILISRSVDFEFLQDALEIREQLDNAHSTGVTSPHLKLKSNNGLMVLVREFKTDYDDEGLG